MFHNLCWKPTLTFKEVLFAHLYAKLFCRKIFPTDAPISPGLWVISRLLMKCYLNEIRNEFFYAAFLKWTLITLQVITWREGEHLLQQWMSFCYVMYTLIFFSPFCFTSTTVFYVYLHFLHAKLHIKSNIKSLLSMTYNTST